MDRIELMKKVTSIFCDVLDEEEIQLSETSTADDVEDWDSLSHVLILAELEKSFEIRFNTREIEGLENVGAMLDLISSKLD